MVLLILLLFSFTTDILGILDYPRFLMSVNSLLERISFFSFKNLSIGRGPLMVFLSRSNSYSDGIFDPPSSWMLVIKLLLTSIFLRDLSYIIGRSPDI